MSVIVTLNLTWDQGDGDLSCYSWLRSDRGIWCSGASKSRPQG